MKKLERIKLLDSENNETHLDIRYLNLSTDTTNENQKYWFHKKIILYSSKCVINESGENIIFYKAF